MIGCHPFIHESSRGGSVLKRKDKETRNGVLTVRYESLDCSGCPLASTCLQKHENPESRR